MKTHPGRTASGVMDFEIEDASIGYDQFQRVFGPSQKQPEIGSIAAAADRRHVQVFVTVHV